MNNSQVAHVWAHQSKPRGKGSNFFFEGATIYSYGYHFPIARIVNGAVLFTRRNYSNTTARHKYITLRACSHLPVYYVARVENGGASPNQSDVEAYATEIASLEGKAERARVCTRTYLEQLGRTILEANNFCAHFGFDRRFSWSPKLAEWTARAEKQEANAEKARIEREKKQAILNAEKRAEWLAGGLARYVPGTPLFRVCPSDCSVMQTSLGAEVPMHDAKRAFRFVMSKRASGWKRNGETFTVGDFQIDVVNETGVVAGCHRIPWEEIERFGRVRGWC